MLFHRTGKYIFIIILAVTLTNCSSSKNATTENKCQTAEPNLDNIISLIAIPQNREIAALLRKWSDFIEQHTCSSNIHYLNAIAELDSEYKSELQNWEEYFKKAKALKQYHSSAWIDELKKQYGIQFIKDNKNAMLSNIQCIVVLNDPQLQQINAMLLYKEAVLFAACRHYFSLFIAFNDTLKKDEKMVLKSRKKAVEAYLSIINNNSIADILFGHRQPDNIYEIKAKEENPELFKWFTDHVDPTRFDPMRAAVDLDKITRDES